jgi:hypothetical protein
VNQSRRHKIVKLLDKLEDVKISIDYIHEDEKGSLDGLPDKVVSERSEQVQTAAEALETAKEAMAVLVLALSVAAEM